MSDPTFSAVPEHVAIIMDGNGRWANARGLPRTMGHRKGVEAVRETVRAAGDIGVKYLTLFAFSSENWRRPETEVSDLLGLLKAFIRRDLAELHRQNVRIRVIGDRSNLRGDILPLLIEAEETTRDNTALTLVIAFNYGSRDEIARAVVSLAKDVEAGRLRPQDISPELVDARLDTAGIPDPDLIIRTSGEERLSNFLCGRPPIRNSCSCRNTGPISAVTCSSPRWRNMPRATGALAASPASRRRPWGLDEP